MPVRRWRERRAVDAACGVREDLQADIGARMTLCRGRPDGVPVPTAQGTRTDDRHDLVELYRLYRLVRRVRVGERR
ncbi:hypothetical protein ACWF9B_25910 [Streptomyces sp. NPDC055089]